MATRRAHLFIEEHLRAAGLSDEDAVERLGIARETMYRWRTDQDRLNPTKIQRLADLLGISPADLWRLPGDDSIDAMLDDAPTAVRQMAAEVIRALLRKQPTS